MLLSHIPSNAIELTQDTAYENARKEHPPLSRRPRRPRPRQPNPRSPRGR
jgi:hypothetical protein